MALRTSYNYAIRVTCSFRLIALRMSYVFCVGCLFWLIALRTTYVQGPRSKFSSGGAKEECVKENFLGGPGEGACLWISIQFLSPGKFRTPLGLKCAILFATMLFWKVEIRTLEWFRYIDLYSFAGCRLINLSLDWRRLRLLTGYCGFYFTSEALLKNVKGNIIRPIFQKLCHMKKWLEIIQL